MALKIFSWNVNGIRAVQKKGALQSFIDQEDPDIVCFQEIKAHPDQLDLDYPQYQKFWNAGQRKGYSGTAIWTKQPPLSVTYDMPEDLVAYYDLGEDDFGDPSNEGRVTSLEFADFILSTVYTPNSKGDLGRLELRDKRWDPAFLDYMKSPSKPVIFCGDLNVAHKEIDLANPKPNMGKHGFTTEERSGFDNILKAGFLDSFRQFDQTGDNYTWWTHWAKARQRNVGWRIDYFLVTQELKNRLKNAKIHADVMGSDHCPVSITLEETS